MIAAETVEAIANDVMKQGVDEQCIATLRQQYPDIHFTYCSDDDIHSGKPVISREGFNLYLIDSSEHCLALTKEYDIATGVVVAEVFEDDD